MMLQKSPIYCVLLAALALNVASGQVSVEGNFFDTYVPGTYVNDSQVDNAVTSYTVNLADLTGQGFSAAGTDKLALAISTKWASNAGGAVTSLTYNGVSMSQAVSVTQTRSRDEIWYLDSVASDGNIDLVFDAVTEGFAIGLWALNGTQAGFGDTNTGHTGGSSTVDLTTTSPGAFVLWEAADNWGTVGYSGTYDTAASQFGGRGGSRVLWNVENSIGTYSEAISSGRSDTGQVGAVFEAVPEPSAAFLIGVFGSLLLLRRRR